MATVSVQDFSLHHVDIPNNTKRKANTPGRANDLDDFISNVLNELFDEEKGQEYRFANESELVPSMILQIANGGDWVECTEQIADKLLREEVEKQEAVRGITTLLKGSLLQVRAISDGLPIIVVMKIEHDEYVDEEELKYHSGLPTTKRRYQRSSVIFFDESNHPVRILKSGNPNIAEYWWKRFFSCEPITDSSKNTSKAYAAIDKFLKKEIKKISSGDYYFLINEVNYYFKSNESFDYTDVASKLESYTPDDKALSETYDDVMSRFKKMPSTMAESLKFDTQFDLDFSAVRNKVNRKIVLAENFELSMKGDIEEFKKLIKADVDEDGRKYIKIYSDAGYSEFS